MAARGKWWPGTGQRKSACRRPARGRRIARIGPPVVHRRNCHTATAAAARAAAKSRAVFLPWEAPRDWDKFGSAKRGRLVKARNEGGAMRGNVVVAAVIFAAGLVVAAA